MKKKDYIVIGVGLLCIAITLLVGITYAYWILSQVQKDTNVINSSCFNIAFEEGNAIALNDAYPIADEEGLQLSPYTFTITNTCAMAANYQINLETITEGIEKVLPDEYIKANLQEGETPIINSVLESNLITTKTLSNAANAYKLYTGRLEKEESKTYNLRIWMDGETPAIDEVMNASFQGKITINFSATINATNDITPPVYTIYVNEEEQDEFPTKGNYKVEINCSSGSASWDEDNWEPIVTDYEQGATCTVQFNQFLSEVVQEGDYITMTPTATSYTIPTSTTGYTSDQTINPSELNLWRVIRKNDDGTVEVVSEYVSSTNVYFRGETGYLNLVGGLNEIATQYTNEKYVQSTRHIGYSNQTSTCTTVSACLTDTSYEADTNLVQTAIGALIGKTPSGEATVYWLASRYVSTGSNGTYYYERHIIPNGELGYYRLYAVYTSGNTNDTDQQYAIRPILTLKADVTLVSGDGTASLPYQLS